MYAWLVYLHLLGFFGFLLANRATTSAAFALRRQRSLERVRALLERSGRSTGLMYLSLLVSLPSSVAAGVVATFLGHWWGQGWIWVSPALLIAISAAMGALGSRSYGEARTAAR